MVTESKHSYKDLAVKISIELTELIESYQKRNCPDILERIELKKQLLKQIRELLVQEKRAVENSPELKKVSLSLVNSTNNVLNLNQ